MMNPKALEALRQARALFEQSKADDIPESITNAPDPIRKPRVHLLPTEPVKFTKETMKQEHKAEGVARVMQENGMTPPKQLDKYVGMSTRKACEACLAQGIKKPSDIAKETGKDVNQIYTALWHIKTAKKKARAVAKAERLAKLPSPTQQADDWDREPTPFEDAHMVVLHDREWYEAELTKMQDRIGELLLKNQELKTIIKYLESKHV